MNADVAGAIFTIAALAGAAAATLALAACIVQARTNARHRAIRQAMRAELIDGRPRVDQLIEEADFRMWTDELIDGGMPNPEDVKRLAEIISLREFAAPTPPKPDEPTGLGAVVIDAGGDAWVHDREANPGYLGVEWLNVRTQAHRHYRSIDVVRVLSEGA